MRFARVEAWALVAALAPVSAWASCAAGTACEGGWLWRYALPAVVILGLVTWVIGPFLFQVVSRLRPGRKPGRT